MSTAQLTDHQVLELGAKLRSAREKQGKDIADAAFRIALSPSQLRALESGDRRPFYSTHYFLQAVKRYADFLRIDLPEIAHDDAAPAMALAADAPITAPASEQASAQMLAADEPPVITTNMAASATPRVTSPSYAINDGRRSNASRRRPSLALMAMAAAVIALAAVMNLKENAPPNAAAVATPATVATEPAATVSATAPAAPGNDQPAPAAAATSNVAQAIAMPPAATVAAPVASAAVARPDAIRQPVAAPATEKDSTIESTANAWVQIVSKTGEKSNLRLSPGESIAFVSSETAAVVIGQPEKATLMVRGKSVDLRQYASGSEGSPRALVIIGNIRN